MIKSEQRTWAAANETAAVFGSPGGLSDQAAPTAGTGAQAANAAPGAAQTAEAAGKTAENYVRDFALGREVSVTRNALGTVKRLSVAVALRNPETGKPRSAKEIAALEQLIKGAVGYDQGRGDVVAVSARKFVAADAVGLGEKWYEASWVSMLARNLSALLVALVLVFGIGRPLLKRRSAMKAEETALMQERKTDRKSTRLNSS